IASVTNAIIASAPAVFHQNGKSLKNPLAMAPVASIWAKVIALFEINAHRPSLLYFSSINNPHLTDYLARQRLRQMGLGLFSQNVQNSKRPNSRSEVRTGKVSAEELQAALNAIFPAVPAAMRRERQYQGKTRIYEMVQTPNY